jgi:hypothetical protein
LFHSTRAPLAHGEPQVYIRRSTGAKVMGVAFDTLTFAQTLRDKARVPQDQAEGIAQAFSDATGEQIATKTDLQGTESRLGTKIADVKTDLRQTESRLEAKIAEFKAELLLVKWMMGFVLAFQVAIFIKQFMH